MPSALARRRKGYEHEVAVREHRMIVDEPERKGGGDQGPTPTELLAASLASCTAITIEMYAGRKDWELGEVAVAVDFTEATSDDPPRFDVEIKVPAELSEDQTRRILTIAAKCPVHRALASEDVELYDTLETVAA